MSRGDGSGTASVLDVAHAACAPLAVIQSHVRDAVVWADAGVQHALASLGGLRALTDAGAAKVLSLCVPTTPRRPEAGAAEAAGDTRPRRAVVLVSQFVWEAEAAMRACLRATVWSEVVVACTLSGAAHTAHPNPGLARRLSLRSYASTIRLWLAPGGDGTRAAVRVLHWPLAMCVTAVHPSVTHPEAAAAATPHSRLAGAFALAQPGCRRAPPVTLYRTASSAPSVADVTAEDLPQDLRAQCRLVAYSLADAIRLLRVDVADAAFALGKTSTLVGNKLLQVLDADADADGGGDTGGRAAGGATAGAGAGVGGAGGGAATFQPPTRKASLLLVDRSLDVATPFPPTAAVNLVDAYAHVVPSTAPDCGTAPLSHRVDAVHQPPAAAELAAAYPDIAAEWPAGCALPRAGHPAVGPIVYAMSCARPNVALDLLCAALRAVVEHEGCPVDDGAVTAGAAVVDVAAALLLAVVQAGPGVSYRYAALVQCGCAALLAERAIRAGVAASGPAALLRAVARRGVVPPAASEAAAELRRQVVDAVLAAPECQLRQLGLAPALTASILAAQAGAHGAGAGDGDGDWAKAQLRLEVGDLVDDWLVALRQVPAIRTASCGKAYASVPPQGLLAAVVGDVLATPKAELPDVEPLGSALQNLGRAALQATSSMLSWLGDVGSAASGILGKGGAPHPADNDVVIVVVVGGGVTHAELAAVADVVATSPGYTDKQVVVGSSAHADDMPVVL